MNTKGVRPENVLPDSENFATKDGVTIRKGTMAAMLANADIIENPGVSAEEKAAALAVIKELAPILKGIGLMKHITWKNPEIQLIFDDLI